MEGWCSTIELHPHIGNCPEPESNQRHEDFQSSALPTELSGPAELNWAEVDSNHRSKLQQIYSLSPLATRESAHVIPTSQDDSIFLMKKQAFCCQNPAKILGMGAVWLWAGFRTAHLLARLGRARSIGDLRSASVRAKQAPLAPGTLRCENPVKNVLTSELDARFLRIFAPGLAGGSPDGSSSCPARPGKKYRRFLRCENLLRTELTSKLDARFRSDFLAVLNSYKILRILIESLCQLCAMMRGMIFPGESVCVGLSGDERKYSLETRF